MQTAIRAILFDMDGVLIDAKEWHYEALNNALNLFGMQISRIDHLTTFDGLPTRKKLEILSFDRGLPKELHEFINEMKQVFTMQIIHARCKPTFIHELALSTLRAKGYKVAVCSNSIRATINLMMEKAGLLRHLNLIVSAEDVEKPKPDPQMYLRAAELLELQPHECLIVEDNDNGVKAAIASGAHLLVVKSVEETNLHNILKKISQIESAISR